MILSNVVYWYLSSAFIIGSLRCLLLVSLIINKLYQKEEICTDIILNLPTIFLINIIRGAVYGLIFPFVMIMELINNNVIANKANTFFYMVSTTALSLNTILEIV